MADVEEMEEEYDDNSSKWIAKANLLTIDEQEEEWGVYPVGSYNLIQTDYVMPVDAFIRKMCNYQDLAQKGSWLLTPEEEWDIAEYTENAISKADIIDQVDKLIDDITTHIRGL